MSSTRKWMLTELRSRYWPMTVLAPDVLSRDLAAAVSAVWRAVVDWTVLQADCVRESVRKMHTRTSAGRKRGSAKAAASGRAAAAARGLDCEDSVCLFQRLSRFGRADAAARVVQAAGARPVARYAAQASVRVGCVQSRSSRSACSKAEAGSVERAECRRTAHRQDRKQATLDSVRSCRRCLASLLAVAAPTRTQTRSELDSPSVASNDLLVSVPMTTNRPLES